MKDLTRAGMIILSIPQETFDQKIDALHGEAVTPALMHKIRRMVEDEQREQMREEPFWVLHRRGVVKVLNEPALRNLIAREQDEPMYEDCLSIEDCIRDLKMCRWEVY